MNNPLSFVGDGPGGSLAVVLQTVMALGFVLILIYLMAWTVGRFQRSAGSTGGAMKMISGLSVGAKEKIVLIEVDGERFIVGVAPGCIVPIDTLGKRGPVQAQDSSQIGNTLVEVRQ